MMIWLTLLPWSLWDTCGLLMIPVTAMVAFLLLGEQQGPPAWPPALPPALLLAKCSPLWVQPFARPAVCLLRFSLWRQLAGMQCTATPHTAIDMPS
jgi:hypothetical protein